VAFVEYVGSNKIVPGHTVKVYWGSSNIAPLIHSLGVTWKLAVNITFRPLYLREKVTGIQWTGDWVGLTTGVGVLNNECLALRGSELGSSSPYRIQDWRMSAVACCTLQCTAAPLREPRICFGGGTN
jgi:hypothetical protein